MLRAIAKVDEDESGFTYASAYFTLEEWVFVLCASRGVDRVEVLRRVGHLMKAALAFYGVTNCMVIEDRDGVSSEAALSRPGVELTLADHAAGMRLFGHVRHTTTPL